MRRASQHDRYWLAQFLTTLYAPVHKGIYFHIMISWECLTWEGTCKMPLFSLSVGTLQIYCCQEDKKNPNQQKPPLD